MCGTPRLRKFGSARQTTQVLLVLGNSVGPERLALFHFPIKPIMPPTMLPNIQYIDIEIPPSMLRFILHDIDKIYTKKQMPHSNKMDTAPNTSTQKVHTNIPSHCLRADLPQSPDNTINNEVPRFHQPHNFAKRHVYTWLTAFFFVATYYFVAYENPVWDWLYEEIIQVHSWYWWTLFAIAETWREFFLCLSWAEFADTTKDIWLGHVLYPGQL